MTGGLGSRKPVWHILRLAPLFASRCRRLGVLLPPQPPPARMSGGKRVPGPAAILEWPCEACTFLNHLALSECEICGTPRPAAPAPAPGLSLAVDGSGGSQTHAELDDKDCTDPTVTAVIEGSCDVKQDAFHKLKMQAFCPHSSATHQRGLRFLWHP